MRHRSIAAALLATSLAALAGSTWARNEKLMLPIEPAMRSQGTRQLVAPDIPLRFGKASGQGMDITAGVAVAHGVATPYTPGNSNNGGRPGPHRRDEIVCLDAFRQALVQLQSRARAAGATAVVGIVSNYNGIEEDSPSAYECHIGHSRGVVDLKGQLARGPLVQPAVAAPPLPRGSAHTDGAAAPAQPPRIASGFAAIDDIDAIPYLSDRGRNDYADWLKLPTPRAFAIADDGHYWHTSGLKPKDTTLPTDPSERALLMCERAAQKPCKLYAVNRSVVWVKAPQ
jgi:hypothetical protein